MLRSDSLDPRLLADEELLTLIADGDERGFEVIFDRHSGAAFSLAYRMCGRRPVAEKVVREAFLSLWRSSVRYDPARGSVRSWVLGVVHNRTLDASRRRAVGAQPDTGDEGAGKRIEARERTEVQAASREDARRVRGALQGMPADQRRVIELAYFGGFTHSQIATMLELPTGTVKGRMRQGLAKLRLAVGDQVEVA